MSNNFAKDLLKGKIAELIFSQMFQSEGKYTVIPFGYERTLPEIAQYLNKTKRPDIIKSIRNAPDFALVSRDREFVFLVEVKYRSKINMHEILETAKELKNRWEVVWLFVATPEEFYFNTVNQIIKEEELETLKNGWISKKHQEKYLDFLNEFITAKKIIKNKVGK